MAQTHGYTARTQEAIRRQGWEGVGGGGGPIWMQPNALPFHRILEASWKMNREFREVLCVLVKSTVVNVAFGVYLRQNEASCQRSLCQMLYRLLLQTLKVLF